MRSHRLSRRVTAQLTPMRIARTAATLMLIIAPSFVSRFWNDRAMSRHWRQRVEHDADKAGDGGPVRILIPFGTKHPDCDAGKHQQRANPPDDAENRIKHADSPAPAFAVDRLCGQEQPERDEAQVIHEMAQGDDALGEVIEVIGNRQRRQHLLHRRPRAFGHPVHGPEEEQHGEGRPCRRRSDFWSGSR